MRWKWTLASPAVAVMISAPALAADLGSAPEEVAPIATISPTYNWTGAYIGGHIGWGWDQADFTLDNAGWWGGAGVSADIDSDGFLGGAQIGYLRQTPSNFVYGVDISVSAADLGEAIASPAFPGIDTWPAGIDWFVLTQARLGYANNRWLGFIQGGYAGADGDASATPPFVSDSNWHNGWTIGAGLSFKATNRFSLGAEYNYIDLGSETYNIPFGGAPLTASVDHQVHVLKATANIHFGGP
jgi:outer membrane immunogenic protein